MGVRVSGGELCEAKAPAEPTGETNGSLQYIKQHERSLYAGLITSGKLNGHLADIDEQANEIFPQKETALQKGCLYF